MIAEVCDQIYASKTKCTKLSTPILRGLYVAQFVECGVLQDPLRGTGSICDCATIDIQTHEI